MTGGNVLKGRLLYGKYIQFSINGKILLATNSLPSINNTDHGIWRRIQAIPFNRTFTSEQQDKGLGSKLNKELPGILNWAIKGCLDWQQQGLNPPQIVLEQVSAYKTEMDSIAQFVEQECDIDPDTRYSAPPAAITVVHDVTTPWFCFVVWCCCMFHPLAAAGSLTVWSIFAMILFLGFSSSSCSAPG